MPKWKKKIERLHSGKERGIQVGLKQTIRILISALKTRFLQTRKSDETPKWEYIRVPVHALRFQIRFPSYVRFKVVGK